MREEHDTVLSFVFVTVGLSIRPCWMAVHLHITEAGLMQPEADGGGGVDCWSLAVA